MQNKNLVSVSEYAKLSDVTAQAIHNRVKAGTLEFAETEPVLLIDITSYPPGKISLGRKPYKSAFL